MDVEVSVSAPPPASVDGSKPHTPSTLSHTPFAEICDQVAFLAVPLCQEAPKIRTYWHDLESIAWAIFYILATYRRGWRIENSAIAGWWEGNWDTISSAKKSFLTESSDWGALFAEPFAESLGVDPGPLRECMTAWCNRLSKTKRLEAEFMLSTLSKAETAYGE